MRASLLSSILAAIASLASAGYGSPLLGQGVVHRQAEEGVIRAFDGISEPTNVSIIAGGSSFSFLYEAANSCFNGYSPFNVWLVPGPNPPTGDSLNSTAEFSPGDYLAYFGSYVVSTFNFPPLPEPTGPPPATLTMPVLDPSFVGETVYIAVVETLIGCYPDRNDEYGLSSVGVTYTDSD
ncbi:hypothetical protein NM688_g4941 [Phlebia brevispora]|uniref:Uncharacterized protein n=1 Tax=Phlebia brevispora TaxID=194682 RepID=A0ACC1T1G4_9APHY|nr:hypothetical protein NM688_g4941 [Phlebia brevispora]